MAKDPWKHWQERGKGGKGRGEGIQGNLMNIYPFGDIWKMTEEPQCGPTQWKRTQVFIHSLPISNGRGLPRGIHSPVFPASFKCKLLRACSWKKPSGRVSSVFIVKNCRDRGRNGNTESQGRWWGFSEPAAYVKFKSSQTNMHTYSTSSFFVNICSS